MKLSDESEDSITMEVDISYIDRRFTEIEAKLQGIEILIRQIDTSFGMSKLDGMNSRINVLRHDLDDITDKIIREKNGSSRKANERASF